MLGMVPKGLESGAGRGVNWRTNCHHPDYSIAKINQNPEKSPGDLRRLAVTQTPVKPSANAGVRNLQEIITIIIIIIMPDS